MSTVYESAALPDPRGGSVVLVLLLTPLGARTQVAIEREHRLAHETLTSTVARIQERPADLDAPARALTTVAHELERLHGQGYWLRERAGGGIAGTSRMELVPPGDALAAASWKSDLTRKAVEKLAARLSTLDVPDARYDDTERIAALMRGHGAEVRRRHAVDALIAENPTQSAEELVQELERRRLLD